MKNLVTTFNSKTWEDDNSIFCGKWCIPFEKEKIISNNKIIQFHWSDKSKLQKDYLYLEKIYKEILFDLTKVLNNYHGTKLNPKSWNLLLSPWLISVITIIFDKYECIKSALKQNSKYKIKILKHKNSDFSSYNYKDFILNKTSSDNWHHIIFGDIITKVFKENFLIKKVDSTSPISNDRYNFQFDLKDRLKNIISLKFFLKRNNVFLDSNYVGFIDFIKLMINNKQVPFWISAFHEKIELKINNFDLNLREKISKQITKKRDNPFELYLYNNIMNFIPMSYLENFSEYQKKISNLKFFGSEIVSRGAHFSNDLYKHWCMNQLNKGKKHYISFHGGGIPQKYLNFEYEYEIADKVIMHNNLYKDNQIKLPVLNKNPKIKFKKNSKKILLITKPIDSKFTTRISFEPNCTDELEVFHNLMNFVNKINKKIKKNVCARFLYESWDLNERFKYLFEGAKIDKNIDYFTSLKSTRIVVSSYLSTPFAEAVNENIPSLCLLKKEDWYFHEKFHSLINKMKKNNILFYSAAECAEHVNENYQKINEWWNSHEVKSTIIEFNESVYFYNKDKKLEDWINFLRMDVNNK